MGFPQQKSVEQSMVEYRRYYDALATEEAKAQLLVMFKERRDKQGDTTCGKLLAELGQRFITEKFKG